MGYPTAQERGLIQQVQVSLLWSILEVLLRQTCLLFLPKLVNA
jgi:hypothetical protein